ncbi:MAG: hypothetical protein ACKO0U_04705 [Gammaproteobacteria bacterium]
MPSTDTLQQDVGYLRQLAEAGRDAPLSAGPYLVAGGGWFGLASLLMGLVDLSGQQSARDHLWLAFLLSAAGFSAHLAVLIRRERHRVQNHVNLAINAAWTAAGFGIFFFWMAATIVSVRHQSGFFMNAMPLLVLTVYAMAWWIAAVVSRQRWMQGVVAIAVLSMVVVAAAIGTRYVWLAYALALFGTALIPGIKLVRLAATTRAAARE